MIQSHTLFSYPRTSALPTAFELSFFKDLHFIASKTLTNMQYSRSSKPFDVVKNNRRMTAVRVVAGDGFGKKTTPKAKPDPVAKTTVVPASVDPKNGWRGLGSQSALFELKPVKGVEVPAKAVAVYQHNGKVYCR